ncbi:MAG: addiction module protein [Nitrospirae bacterium]|nr:addiction module protein [Nitrospirota bacterium]MCL5977759.1 addiction module protein [Nitrospirota bacterium]
MSRQSEQVLAEALDLPPIERAEIVEKLLTSFEFSERKTIDELWAQEAESRIDAYERGEISAIPAKEVFEKIEQRKG